MSVLAAGANFKQLLSVVTYVGITAIVAQLATLVVLILGKPGSPRSAWEGGRNCVGCSLPGFFS